MFFWAVLDAVVGHRVGGEDLGHRAGLLLFQRLDLFEEVDERGRDRSRPCTCTAGRDSRLRASKPRENVRNPSGSARLAPWRMRVAGPAAHEDQRDGGEVDRSGRGSPAGAVARRDVRDLVRHDAGQFGFVLGLQDQAGVHEEEAARQRERVHFFGVEHLDGEGHLGVGVAHQVLADAVDVLGDDRIVDDLGLALDFLRQLLAEGDFFLERVEVDALADIAIADFVGIFLLCLRRRFAAELPPK